MLEKGSGDRAKAPDSEGCSSEQTSRITVLYLRDYLDAVNFRTAIDTIATDFRAEMDLPSIPEIGVVCEDVIDAAEELERDYPEIGPFLLGQGATPFFREDGAPVRFQSRVGFGYCEDVLIELIEPGEGSNAFRDFLEPGRITIHHIGFWARGFNLEVGRGVDRRYYRDRMRGAGYQPKVEAGVSVRGIFTTVTLFPTMKEADGLLTEFIDVRLGSRSGPEIKMPRGTLEQLAEHRRMSAKRSGNRHDRLIFVRKRRAFDETEPEQALELDNFHKNVTFEPLEVWRLTNLPNDGSTPTPSERRRIGQRNIARVLARAEKQPTLSLRAIGAGWSLSRAADTRGWLLRTEGLPFTKTRLNSVHARSPYKPEGLAWVQCGTRVAMVNASLGAKGRSLLTTGASNGQTIVGAIATGTHGSAFNIGSMHDTVRGMHVMCSSTRSVWLEANSEPVVNDSVARKAFGEHVQIIRDDDVFHSALVSFGSFGIVESIVVETTPLFLLSVRRERCQWDDALQAKVRSLDLRSTDLGEIYHFEVVFDPLEIATGRTLRPWVITMYRKPAPRGYVYSPASKPQNTIVADIAALRWGTIGARLAPKLMLEKASKLLHERLPLLDGSQPAMPLGRVFTDVVVDAPGASTEIAVPAAQAPRAVALIVDVLREAFEQRRPFAGSLALRFVRASKATLAFTHFEPVTCCIELPGARLPWTQVIYQRIWDTLDRADMQYALHWGQENDFSPERIRKSFGQQRIERWLRARARVLNTPQLCARFSNPMLQTCGLSRGGIWE